MKRIALITVVAALFLAGCAGDPEVSSRIRVISIGYHSDDCEECVVLEGKMRKMNLRFALSPIVFIKYDKTSETSRLAAEERLQAADMLAIAREEDGLRKVVLYDAKTREKIVAISPDDPVREIRSKIRDALTMTR